MTNRKRNISSVELDTDIVHSPRELTCKYEAVNTTVQPACTVLTVRLSGDSNSPLGSVPLSRVMHHCGMQRILQNLWAETWLLLTHGWGRRSTALLRTFSVWLRTSELPESLSERTTTKKKKKTDWLWFKIECSRLLFSADLRRVLCYNSPNKSPLLHSVLPVGLISLNREREAEGTFFRSGTADAKINPPPPPRKIQSPQKVVFFVCFFLSFFLSFLFILHFIYHFAGNSSRLTWIKVPTGSPKFTWWGSCGLCCKHKSVKLAHPFYFVLASISAFMALSPVFHSITSPNSSPLLHSVLPVLFLLYCSFQLYICLWKSPCSLM